MENKTRQNFKRNRKGEIGKLEKQINQMVYKLYGLTPEEIKTVERLRE